MSQQRYFNQRSKSIQVPNKGQNSFAGYSKKNSILQPKLSNACNTSNIINLSNNQNFQSLHQNSKKQHKFKLSNQENLQQNFQRKHSNTQKLKGFSKNKSKSKDKKANNSIYQYKKSSNAFINSQETVKIYESCCNNFENLNQQFISYQKVENSSEFIEAKQLYEQKKYPEAIEQLKHITNTHQTFKEGFYYLAISYLSSSFFKESIENFEKFLSLTQNVKKNVYLLLSIAYKKTNKIQKAIDTLSIGIQYYPQYYDFYTYRGKLFQKQKKYQKAQQDFENAIKIDQKNILGYLSLCESFRYQKEYDLATQMYTELLKIYPEKCDFLYLKRAIAFIEQKKFDHAKRDLERLSEQQNSEIFYFKGYLELKNEKIQEAVLYFEQSVKHNNNKQCVTKSLYEIAKIKIKKNDFYEAFYTLQRAEFLNVDMKLLNDFIQFTDGVTFIMKRKYKEGIAILSKMNISEQCNLIRPMIQLYRSYGYFCIGKFNECQSDLEDVEKIQKISEGQKYNLYVSQAIQMCQQNQFENSLSQFSKAQQIQQNKMEPYLYKSIALIKFVSKLISKEDPKYEQYLQNSLKYVQKGIEIQDTSQAYFIKSILEFSLGNLKQAKKDIDSTIDKSEDNFAIHFYIRAMICATFGDYKGGIQDLSITLQLDQNFSEAYLNRAKCFHQIGDRNQAFIDLQKYIQLKPSNPEIHIWAGNLLFNIGGYNDAIKAFTHAYNIYNQANINMKQIQKSLIQKIKCMIVQQDLEQVQLEIKNLQLNKLVSSEMYTKFENDIISITSLNSIQQEEYTSAYLNLEDIQEGYFFKSEDIWYYQGIIEIYRKNYNSCNSFFKKSLEKLKQSDDSDEDEQLEFHNCTYNILEYQLNLIILQILMKEYNEVIEPIQLMQQILNEEDQKFMLFQLETIIQNQLDNKTQEVGSFQLNLFADQKRFSNTLAPLDTKIGETTVQMHLSFSLPKVQLPSMEVKFDEKIFQKIQITDVENKPEAPWITKNQQGIVFTDNLQIFNELDLQTDTKKQRSPENIQEIDQFYEAEGFNSFTYDEQPIPDFKDKNALKQQLLLDMDIEQKLQKIVKK